MFSLSSYPFAHVMDEPIHNIEDDVLWYVFLANDMMSIDTARKGMEGRLRLWKTIVKVQEFKISPAKTTDIKCDFWRITCYHKKDNLNISVP